MTYLIYLICLILTMEKQRETKSDEENVVEHGLTVINRKLIFMFSWIFDDIIGIMTSYQRHNTHKMDGYNNNNPNLRPIKDAKKLKQDA